MAKIKGPLLSHEARGTIAEKLTFSVRSSGQQARFQKKQKDILTAGRVSQREIYSDSVEAWNALSQEEKAVYNQEAGPYEYTGYNLFMRLFLSDYIQGRNKAFYGIAIFGNTIYGET